MTANIATPGDMSRAIRERGYEVSGSGCDGMWSLVATRSDGSRIEARGARTYAAAIRYLYNAIVGDSAPQGGM